jgi:hypothetical protein
MTEIFEYIRRRKNGKVHKVGVILGRIEVYENNQIINIGWSKCNGKLGDTFNLEQGLELARARARNETPTTVPVPLCIKSQIRKFSSRCVRYFKDAKRLEIPA